MVIDVYATCYNEEIILPYFIRHYRTFTRDITIFNNKSTDKSVEIMQQNNINIIDFDTNNKFEESTLMSIRNSCWKGSDADWVIVCDADELIYHKDIKKVLSTTKSTLIICDGFEMMSEELPKTNGQIYDELKNGFFKKDYSKPCLFKPNEIKEINFAPGSHTSKPIGNVITIGDENIKLLHYKYLNREVLINKYAHYKNRQSEEMKKNGWGNYQQWDSVVINNQFNEWLKISNKIIE